MPILEVDDFRADASILDNQPPYRNRQGEPLRSRASRIEVEHAILGFLLGNVTVAVDDGGEARRFWLQIQPNKDMQDVNRDAFNL